MGGAVVAMGGCECACGGEKWLGKGWWWMGCIVKRSNCHQGRRFHSIADCILVSTRAQMFQLTVKNEPRVFHVVNVAVASSRTPSPARSSFSFVEIAPLGVAGMTFIASELMPTGGVSGNTE